MHIIIAMYGDAKVTPALHGCHGNSIIYYQWQQFDSHSENFAMNMRKFEGYPLYAQYILKGIIKPFLFNSVDIKFCDILTDGTST